MQNKTNKLTIKDPRSQLQIFTNRKEGRRKIWSRTKWMKLGDWMNKYLFSLVKERPAGGLIIELYDDETNVVSSSADLARMCDTLYSKLYAKHVPDGQ